MLVGGLVAFGAYKFSQRDAKRIEEHAGMDPEEMTDEELEQAMQELGIEKQLRTADDVEEGAGAAAPAAGGSSDIEQIKELAALHEQGILTDDEFAAQKAKILGL